MTILLDRIDLAASGSMKQKRPVDFVRDYFQDKTLAQGIGLSVEVNPSRFVEQAYFTVHLMRDSQCSSDPIFSGIFSAGRPSQTIVGWLDGDYFDTATFANAEQVVLGELNLDVELFKILGGLVAPGGSMMISYSLFSKSSRVHRDTKTGLERGFPPVVTPLGFLLFMAGCGMDLKNRHSAEGHKGPEKLQGYKPANQQAADEKGEGLLQELQLFISRPRADDDLTRECVSRARIMMHELHGSR